MDYLVKNLRYFSNNPDLHRSQVATGEGAGVGQSAISKIINERTKEPGYRTVMRLARHYGLSIDDLVNRDLEAQGGSGSSQPVGPSDETMAQAVELLHLMGMQDPRISGSDAYLGPWSR